MQSPGSDIGPVRRLLGVGVVALFLVAACGPGATASSPPVSSPTPAASVAPSASVSPDAAAQIAELKTKLQGQKVVIGTSAFPNASITGAFKTVEYLEEDFGLDVDFRVLDSDPLVAAMVSGQIQVGQLSLAGMANVVSAGADFIAFGGDDQKNTFLVASKDPVESIEEMRGQPFGVTQNLNQITGQTARKCLQEAGLDIEKDVQLLRLSNTGEVTQAIRSGQVKGGISATFRLTQLRIEDGDIYNILCKGWEANPQISSVWMAAREWIDQNAELALAMNIASLKSARFTQADKQAWVDYATSVVESLTPEAAAIDYDTLVTELDNWPVNGSLDRELCDSTLKTSFEFGAVDKEYAVDDLVTFEFQEQALAILGPA